MTDVPTFWNQDHPRYAEYDTLIEALVPSSGKCETMAGELLRAASRICYDFYNNGFGNNWSGALAYLDAYLGIPRPIRQELRRYARGHCFPERRFRLPGSDGMDEKLNDLVCLVLDRIKVIGIHRPNPVDMLDLTGPSL